MNSALIRTCNLDIGEQGILRGSVLLPKVHGKIYLRILSYAVRSERAQSLNKNADLSLNNHVIHFLCHIPSSRRRSITALHIFRYYLYIALTF